VRAIFCGCVMALSFARQAEAQFTRFANYTEEQGLGNASVSALAQDADGFVMMGTEAGLYRYDGSTVSPYGASAGLPPAAWIRTIAEDGRKRLWVATTDGIYVREGATFSRIDIGRPLHLTSSHLLAFSGHHVVIDTGGTLLRAPVGANGVGSFSPLMTPAVLALHPALDDVRFVVTDAAGGLLIGCGTALCRVQGDRSEMFGAADGLPQDDWQVALRTPDGTLWARSLDRVAWRPAGRATFSSVTVPGERGHFNIAVPSRLGLLADRHGGVLTQGEEGLLDFDGKSWRFIRHHDGGLSANPVQSFMFDREGSLWVGSIGHGAFRSLGWGEWENWTTADGLPSDIVWAITRLRDGQLWVATYGKAAPLSGTMPGVPGGSESASATRAGRLWLAPPHADLVRVDPGRGVVERMTLAANVGATFIDPANRLWLTTDKALLVIADADAPIAEMRPQVAVPQATSQVIFDRAGVVWAATATGIVRRDSSGHFDLVVPASMLKGHSQALAFADDDELWVATDGSGVMRFRITGHDATTLGSIAAPVISSNDVMFLTRDRRGWMWVGTDHGVDMFDGRSWRAFGVGDGMISNDLDQWAVFEDTDASLWFGTSRGLSHLIDPAHLSPVETLHPVITGLSIGERTVRPAPLVRVDWTAAAFVIRFADLDFARGSDLSFRYRMRGLDTGWSETTGREIRYARLPAGKLHFELVAVDTVHHTVSSPLGFTLRIHAPWWRRWWFYAAATLGTAAAIAATWQLRVRLLMRQHRKLETLVGERTAEIEQARHELQWLAMSDSLTGLPNRRAIMQMLDQAIEAAPPSRTPLAVLLCDLDHFKKINDGYGHLAGDAVLTAFGHRLGAAVEAPEAAGRYGGEEFCVIVPGSRQRVLERVAAIRSAIAGAPYQVGGTERAVTSSGGLAFLRPGESALSLLARADAALYRAKERGRDRIEHELMEDAAHARGRAEAVTADETKPASGGKGLEQDLRCALVGHEFVLFYQPVADLERDVVTSCEALIRWHSPSRGWVSPADFIPFAEEVGLMPEIGDWVLRTACLEAVTWPADMKVSVNLSAVQFRLADVVARVEAILAATGLAPERLELEVTETAMIEEMEAAICVLQQLRALGVTVALDDFGTGYSSLSFLRTLPFDRIKIDRSFVQDLGRTEQASIIVGAIAGMAAGLGAAVTAEGAETDEQIEALRAIGIAEIQGYRVGRPCPAADLQAWLAAFRSSRASRLGLGAMLR
jgi:diguanylate cyclase (GGDEF)-like protein